MNGIWPLNRLRTLMVTLLFTASPAGAHAQRASHIRVAAGVAAPDVYVRDWGVQGLVELSANPGGTLDLRAGPSVVIAATPVRPTQPLFVFDVSAVVSLGRPYLGIGLGYTHSELSSSRPFGYDLGYDVLGGLAWGREREWFTEVRLRVFGNVFYKFASTRSSISISVGRGF